MDKKIIMMFLSVLFALSLCCSSKSNQLDSQVRISSDTLYFSKGRVDVRLCKSPYIKIYDNYITVKNHSAQGRSIWIDSVLYLYCGASASTLVISKPDGWNYEFVHFNQDTLIVETVSKNKPAIFEYSLDKFRVVRIEDSLYNSGYAVKTDLLLKLESDGRITDRKKFGTESSNGFNLTVKKDGNALLVLKRNVSNGQREKYYFKE